MTAYLDGYQVLTANNVHNYYAAPILTPLSYGIITDGGFFGDGNPHPASSNGFATLGALQTVYSFATATSNDMAGLMIQAAVNAAHALGIGAFVYLPAGQYRNLPAGIIMPSNTNVQLFGSVQKQSIIMCANSTAGGHPGITIQNAFYGGEAPVKNITLYGFDTGVVQPSGSEGGTPNSSMYTTGSIGLFLTGASGVQNQTFHGLSIFNFDQPVGFDYTNGNIYNDTFYDFVFQFNNKGIAVNGVPPNSFERMSWINGSVSNDNYGIYIITSTSSTPSAGHATGGDFHFTNISLDYNIVNNIYFIGGTADGDFVSILTIADSHSETSTSASGANVARGFIDGNFVSIANQWYEDQLTNTNGCFQMTSGASCTGIANHVDCTNSSEASLTPLFFTTANTVVNCSGYGNMSRNNPLTLLLRTAHGDVSGYCPTDPQNGLINGSTTLTLAMVNVPLLVTSTATITIPLASTENFIIGTQVRITSATGITTTIAGAGGVTVNGTLTFASKEAVLTKTATNIWMVTQSN